MRNTKSGRKTWETIFDSDKQLWKSYNYVQSAIITYISVECYENNYKYGSDAHLIKREYTKLVERKFPSEH